MKKLSSISVALALGAFVTIGMTPAFAQSFIPGFGTGNVLPFAYAPSNDSGKSAYAQAPGTKHHWAVQRPKGVAPTPRDLSAPGH